MISLPNFSPCQLMTHSTDLGSAHVSRAGDGVTPSRTFFFRCLIGGIAFEKDCFGETPKPTRETRALPGWEAAHA